MKRKRLEVVVVCDYRGVLRWPTQGEESGEYDLPSDSERVHLVECGPDEVPMDKRAAAVVRAAVKWATGERYGGSVGLAGDLLRAVERMQKGRRK